MSNMKTAQEFWIEMHGEPDCDGDRMEIAMMAEYGRYVKEQSQLTTKPCEFSTFPTWEEFQEWSPFVHQDTKVIYDYFRTRIQPLEIGREYEFSDDGKKWTLDNLDGYLGKYAKWKHIRPIQADPKQSLIERLRAVEKWYGIREEHRPFDSDEARIVIAEAIKALEGQS
jgi:hypothetical protein